MVFSFFVLGSSGSVLLSPLINIPVVEEPVRGLVASVLPVLGPDVPCELLFDDLDRRHSPLMLRRSLRVGELALPRIINNLLVLLVDCRGGEVLRGLPHGVVDPVDTCEGFAGARTRSFLLSLELRFVLLLISDVSDRHLERVLS